MHIQRKTCLFRHLEFVIPFFVQNFHREIYLKSLRWSFPYCALLWFQNFFFLPRSVMAHFLLSCDESVLPFHAIRYPAAFILYIPASFLSPAYLFFTSSSCGIGRWAISHREIGIQKALLVFIYLRRLFETIIVSKECKACVN